MTYDLLVSDCCRYIIINVTGEITGSKAIEYTVEAHKLGKQKGINRYLVDLTKATNVDSIINNYNFASNELKNAEEIDLDARVATVIDANDNSHFFVEELLKTSGHKVTFFTNLEEAIKYLLADEE